MAKDRVERDDEDLVRLYLTDIGQYTLLTKDDEVRLAKAIEAGNEAIEQLDAAGKELTAAKKREYRRTARKGEEAERQFVQSNLRLVVSIAKKYQASGLPLLDLIQEGNLGLMHAVEKFDWRKGSSSRPTPPGGFVRPSPAALQIPAAPFVSRSTPATPWPASRRRVRASNSNTAVPPRFRAGQRSRNARRQGHRGPSLCGRATVTFGAAPRRRRRRTRRRSRRPLGGVSVRSSSHSAAARRDQPPAGSARRTRA